MASVFCCLQLLFWIVQITRGEVKDFSKHPNWGLLPHGRCGHSHSSSLKPRISGGRNTNITELPWLVEIYKYFKDSHTKRYIGVGCIISDRYVLTDLSCASHFGNPTIQHNVSIDPKTISVGMGNTYKADFKSIHLEVESATAHPNASVCFPGSMSGIGPAGLPTLSAKNDIVLLRTKEKINFTDNIQPICLPFGMNVKNFTKETKFEVGGWGVHVDTLSMLRNHTLGPLLNILQSREVTLLPKENCTLEGHRAYIKSRWPEFLDVFNTAWDNTCVLPPDEWQLCVSEGVEDGDKGAPLMKSVVYNKSNTYFVFGINADYLEMGPAVFTDINPYLKWILDTIKP